MLLVRTVTGLQFCLNDKTVSHKQPFTTMKSILLTVALSVSTFFGILSYLDNSEPAMPECELPAVEIKAPVIRQDTTSDMALPTVTIRAKG